MHYNCHSSSLTVQQSGWAREPVPSFHIAVRVGTGTCPISLFAVIMAVMKMGNIVPRAGIKPTSLAFRASVLPLHHLGSLTSPLFPHLPVYAAPYLRGQCRPLHSSPWNCKLFNAYNYVPTGNGLTYTYRSGSATIHRVACTGSWLWNQSCGYDENGKYCD